MNIRKETDYSTMFAALDALMAAQPLQMELYCKIGRVVGSRAEKGAAVAASEYLQAAYPAADGFSPRNLRRMRNFYRMYGDTLELLAEAMRLNWTQKCGHHGGRIDHEREMLVHSEGRQKRFIQNGVAADD